VRDALHHKHTDQFLRRVDPEARTRRATPVVFTGRTQLADSSRIERNRKAQAESVTRVIEFPLQGACMVNCHQLHRFRGQQPHAIQFAPVQEHLAESQVVSGR